MARIDRSEKPDSQVQQVLDVLAEYERDHPDALIEARRTGYDFIHVRIIDPNFERIERSKLRKDTIWPLFYEKLPDEIISDITRVILVTPEEAPHNGSSIEFDDPLPPLPVPDFWEIEAKNGRQNGMLSLSLEPEEFEAVSKIASSEGVEHSELIRSWVREKLELSYA